MSDLPLRWSASPVPTNPVDRRDWLAAREEKIARMVRKRLRQIIDSAYTAWANTLTAAGDLSAFDSVPIEWQSFVADDLIEAFGGLYIDGSLSVYVQALGTVPIPPGATAGWTQLANEAAVEYQRQATNRLVGVGDNLWHGVRDLTVKSIEAGMSTEELKAQIESFTRFSEFRADTIARTETSAAFVQGSYGGAKALGPYGPKQKVWSASADGRTRATHLDADGQTVAFDEMFIVGEAEMEAPHDPNGPPEEVVNCRCAVQYLFEGEDADLPEPPDYDQLVADEQARVQALIDAGMFD